jgi:hypothetical protein
MVRLCSLSYSEFFYSFPCFFAHHSVIYHCFPSAAYITPYTFFVPLFVPVQYLPSISSIHSISVFPYAFSTLSLDFLFPSPLFSPLFLARLSPILPLMSPPKSIRSSLFSFITSSIRLLLVFIIIAYMDFSFHAFFSSPFYFRFSLIPNFTLFSFPVCNFW